MAGLTLPAAIGLVLAGLVLLAGGGDALVRAATTLASIAGVSPAIIGLTVVAMGTSLPELVVSLFAARSGQPDIAVGNVVGSNIFNIAAALGITAIVIPLPTRGNAVWFGWPVMFAASVGCYLLARDGTVSRIDGAVLVIALIAFVGWTVRMARRSVTGREEREFVDEVEDRRIPPGSTAPARPGIVRPLLVLAVAVAALLLGGRLLVDGAVALARLAGMTERQIALTIVAGGTGMPELATSLMAAFRRRTDVAVANMIGSNIFNILGILGITALVSPIPVSAAIIRSDMWWMIGTAVLLLPLLWSGGKLTRLEGGVLAAAYATYVALLLGR